MEVFVQKDAKTLTVEHKGTASALLLALGINPETVLIVKDGVLVTEEDDVSDARRVELLSVVSGG